MDVFIDEAPFETEAATLAAVLDAVRPRVLEAKRLIVAVRLDGQTLSDAEMDELAERPAPGGELQLVTVDAAELCIEALEDVKNALPGVRDAQQQAAEKLQADQGEAAMQHVAEALHIWQQSQQAIAQSSQLLDLPLESLTVGDRPATEIVANLAQRLTTTREQLKASDWLGLADSLAYELDEAATDWEALLDAMIDRAGPHRRS